MIYKFDIDGNNFYRDGEGFWFFFASEVWYTEIEQYVTVEKCAVVSGTGILAADLLGFMMDVRFDWDLKSFRVQVSVLCSLSCSLGQI